MAKRHNAVHGMLHAIAGPTLRKVCMRACPLLAVSCTAGGGPAPPDSAIERQDAGARDLREPRADLTGADLGHPGKLLFLTSQFYLGDLKTEAGAASGLQGADALCAKLASQAGRGGVWRAWLSSDTVNAIDRISDVGPWFDVNGQRVLANKADLANRLSPGIETTETGGPLGETYAWTGSLLGGVSASLSCRGWEATTSVSGRVLGEGAAIPSFPGDKSPANLPCTEPHPFYCMEQ